MKEFQRFENESDDALIYRITNCKDQIGTWEQVAHILNQLLGTNYTESAFRKKKQSFDKLFNANQDKFIESDSYLNEIKLKTRELEKERFKLKTEKLEYNRWLREDARDEMIKEEIISAIHNLDSLEIPKLIKPIPSNKAYLLAFADCHYGIEYQIPDLFGNIINEYSPEIFESRMWDLLYQTIELIKKENIDTLYVWELGDSLEGILRLNSQLMKLRYGVIESSIKYASFLSTWLNELSKHVRVNFQMVMDSNHNQLRLCGAPKNSFSDENMSKSILLFIKERLKDNKNVNILENPTGLNFSQLTVWNCLGIHGEVKDAEKAANELQRLYQVPVDYLIGAHLHHLEQKEIGQKSEAISIRSIMGINPYAVSIRKAADPGASLLVFDQIKGKICEYSLKL